MTTPAPPLLQASLLLSAAFGAVLAAVAFRPHAHALQLWTRKHGRAHRLLGAAELLLLAAGLADVACWETGRSVSRRLLRLLYDVLLGFCGTALTLSAAAAFSRGNVVNRASGALDKDATVTAGEMLEHAFYQVLNLLQAGYLHCLPAVRGTPRRAALCLLVTGAPWLVRHRFPVNSFSKNYADSPWTLVNVLYRLKKYQYMAYKHALLFGMNASLALSSSRDCLPQTNRSFRLYWVLLNAAYVLECALRPATIDGDHSLLTRRCSLLADAGQAQASSSECHALPEPAADAVRLPGRSSGAAPRQRAARGPQPGAQPAPKTQRLQQPRHRARCRRCSRIARGRASSVFTRVTPNFGLTILRVCSRSQGAAQCPWRARACSPPRAQRSADGDRRRPQPPCAAHSLHRVAPPRYLQGGHGRAETWRWLASSDWACLSWR